MSFLFNGSCYSTNTEAVVAKASQCPTLGNGTIIECFEVAGDLQIKSFDMFGVLLTDYSFPVVFPACPDFIADYVGISMGIILVWVTAWGFRTLMRNI